jgi:hypothetical protein
MRMMMTMMMMMMMIQQNQTINQMICNSVRNDNNNKIIEITDE